MRGICLVSQPRVLLCLVSPSRQALFGDHVKKPQTLEDSDLSRLYMATSLMQIDDNVMRWVLARLGRGQAGGRRQGCPAAGGGEGGFSALFSAWGFFFHP